MNYNIHPLIVHFPIAFLLLYSLLTIVPFHRWLPTVAWREVRLVVLIAGVLGALVASSTGELAEHIARPDERIVEMHAFFASVSTWVYGLLLAGEVLALIYSRIRTILAVPFVRTVVSIMKNVLTHRAVVVVLAIVGVIAISLTGLLGGVMVYGTTADPLAPLVLRLLGLH